MEKTKYKIPFNKPFVSTSAIKNIELLLDNEYPLNGNGFFTQKCQILLENKYNVKKVLLTNSCTAALEMGILLANIKPGDELIMPSYTFVSTANAAVLRGGIPVFVDINSSDLNINCDNIKKAITSKTKAIMPIHYAGNPCDMSKISQIAKEYNLFVIEDNAQGLNSYYNNKALGTFGDIGAISFHYTKNVQAGECGAIYINDENLIDRANIIIEKGTNRTLFQNGIVDKYSWVDIGSSFYPNELTAAYLYSQLENIDYISNERLKIWKMYQQFFSEYEAKEILKTPKILPNSKFNAHIYYVLMNSKTERDKFLNYLNKNQICAQTHFVPLHNSEYGKLHSKTSGTMDITNMAYNCSLRLPMYIMSNDEINYVFEIITEYFNGNRYV